MPPSPATPRTAVLLAGPSGSGKSRVARLAGCPALALDDFYLDGDHPGLPRLAGAAGPTGPDTVDWDHLATLDLATAVATVARLVHHGRAEVPVYDIASSRRTGWRTLELGDAAAFVVEGVFAPEAVAPCRARGLPVVALYLDRPRTLTLVLRLVRDVREHRKPVAVLLRRGARLWRVESALRARALAAGCRPVSLRAALRLVRTCAGQGRQVS